MKKRIGDYPYLIGNANGQKQAIRNSPRDVASYICEEGRYTDLQILSPDGRECLISTYGIYVDQCYDPEYLEYNLRPLLLEMQNSLERVSFGMSM